MQLTRASFEIHDQKPKMVTPWHSCYNSFTKYDQLNEQAFFHKGEAGNLFTFLLLRRMTKIC